MTTHAFQVVPQVADQIRRRFEVPATFEYPGFIRIPAAAVSDGDAGSEEHWAVGVGDEPGQWTGQLLTDDGRVLAVFVLYPHSTDPEIVADLVYVHGIGDRYLGGGCPDCLYRTPTPQLTVAQLQRVVSDAHALKYPDGCRATWSEMCEDCCARVGACAWATAVRS